MEIIKWRVQLGRLKKLSRRLWLLAFARRANRRISSAENLSVWDLQRF
jgi:hypothetical protein